MVVTSVCKTCGREILYCGRGRPRKYCDSCLPQIMALKNFFDTERFRREHPKYNGDRYRNNMDFVVAVTCVFCEEIVLGHGGRRLCDDCMVKWERRPPSWVVFGLSSNPSFMEMPRDLLVWKRIVDLRKLGIRTIRELGWDII